MKKKSERIRDLEAEVESLKKTIEIMHRTINKLDSELYAAKNPVMIHTSDKYIESINHNQIDPVTGGLKAIC